MKKIIKIEDGRIIKHDGDSFEELTDNGWGPLSSPVNMGDIYNGRVVDEKMLDN